MALGVLGGVGPAATVHFLETLIATTPARRDQDHIETIVYNDPTVPDRTDAIRGEDDVRDHLVANAEALDRMDVEIEYVVIASNLTHHWFDDVAAAVDAEAIHVIRTACDEIRERGYERVGLLTTTTAREIGLYERFLDDVEVAYPEEMDAVMESIYRYKAGDEAEARRRIDDQVRELSAEVDALVLGCTEFSAMEWTGVGPTIDPVEVVAAECVERLYTDENAP
jgi:aspartate racemase